MAALTDRIKVSPDVLFNEVAGEAVLLNRATGKYFTLDEVGTRMWQLLVQHGQLEPAYQALLAEYAVEPQQLQEDLLALTDKLAANLLLFIDAA
jgi:hypothetical protein